MSEGKANEETPKEFVAKEMPTEIRILYCKKCGVAINNGLCGYECPEDGEVESHRNPDLMEVRIYTYKGSGPYKGQTIKVS